MKKPITKWVLTFLTFSLCGLVSCGGAGLGVAALLGGGASGAGGQGLNDGFSGASGDAMEDGSPEEGEDAEGMATTTYYIDENGEMVEVAVAGGDDVTAYADENTVGAEATDGALPIDDSAWDESSGSVGSDDGSASGNQMTDERSEYGETELDDITLQNLPVTIAKEDGDEDDGGVETEGDASCSSENREAVSLSYEEGDAHYMTLPEDEGTKRSKKGFKLSELKRELLRQTGSAKESSVQIVFFPDRNIFSETDEDVEVTPVQCGIEEGPGVEGEEDLEPGAFEDAYAWRAMSGDSLEAFEMETGTLRLGKRGSVKLGEKATVMTFTGRSSKFLLRADDFGLFADDDETIPYIILRSR